MFEEHFVLFSFLIPVGLTDSADSFAHNYIFYSTDNGKSTDSSVYTTTESISLFICE